MTEEFSNASIADHSLGDRAEEAFKQAATQVAELVGVHKREIIWTSGVETPSHVLQALNLPSEVIEGALSIGLGKFTTNEEIERAAEILSTAVSKTRQAMLT